MLNVAVLSSLQYADVKQKCSETQSTNNSWSYSSVSSPSPDKDSQCLKVANFGSYLRISLCDQVFESDSVGDRWAPSGEIFHY